MIIRSTARLAILALTTIALPITVHCQQQEAVSRGMPLSFWMARLTNRSDINARSAIKEMGTNALPELLRTLRQIQPASDESRGRALDAVACLGRVGMPALPDILPLLTNQNRQLKIRAFFALKSIGPDTDSVTPIVPVLMRALGDGEWTMRAAAINALSALRPPPPEAGPALVQLLNDPMEYVRQAAMHSLVAQTNPMVIPVLDKQLHDKDTYVVTEAAAQIGVFGTAAAASEPRLRELLDSPLLPIRQAASNALAAITGQSLSQAAPEAKADISLNLPGMSLASFLSLYEQLAGKKVTIAAALPDPAPLLRAQTPRPLTKSEALQYLEEVLKEQAALVITHGPDGSLTAVAKPKGSQH